MKALVTGGGGFLGGAIVRLLLGRGDTVRSFARSVHADLDALGVEQIRGDLADPEAVTRAATGCDIVFHVAAKAGLAGPYADYHRTNVVGSENVLAACRRHGVARLVYTSSPSVVFTGRDCENADEALPYALHFDAAYPRTKALAEQAVRAANGPDLATVCLRPHLIWGPGDSHLVPRILARAHRLRRIGSNNKLIDSTYIENAASAHILAADRLQSGSPLAGRAYFISNGEPLPLWHLVDRILACADLPPVAKTAPTWLAWLAGCALEATYHVLNRRDDPAMTRFLYHELTTAHWFNLSAARRDLGYEPTVSIEEGLRRLRSSLVASRHTPT